MSNLIPSGALRRMLLPPTYGRHVTSASEFTILSVEVWASGLVVNVHLAAEGGPAPRLILEDHFGTKYSLQESAVVDSRNLQVFTPSVPPGTRSLTIRAADDPGRPVVTFAVPLMTVPDAPSVADVPEAPAAREAAGLPDVRPYEPELRRPA